MERSAAPLYARPMQEKSGHVPSLSTHPEQPHRTGWHPHGRFISVGEHVLHYVDLGDPDDPPLVLLHGYLLSSWTWRFNLEALARNHRVIAPCHLGFGYSDRPKEMAGIRTMTDAILGLLDALGLERVSLLGLSMGGAVSLQLAQEHPHRVDRLVLEDSAGVRWNLPAMLRQVPVWLGVLSLRLLPTRWLLRNLLQKHVYVLLPIDEDYMAEFMRPLEARGSRECSIAVARALPHDLTGIEERLDQVSCPTLILWGREDRILSLKVGRILESRIPDARLLIFDQCGHCPHEEHPERFNQEVLDFLGQGLSESD